MNPEEENLVGLDEIKQQLEKTLGSEELQKRFDGVRRKMSASNTESGSTVDISTSGHLKR